MLIYLMRLLSFLFFSFSFLFFNYYLYQWGNLPLIDAAREGNFECLLVLIEYGANINSKNEVILYFLLYSFLFLISSSSSLFQWGETALIGAVNGNNIDCLEYLLEKGAEINILDNVRELFYQVNS